MSQQTPLNVVVTDAVGAFTAASFADAWFSGQWTALLYGLEAGQRNAAAMTSWLQWLQQYAEQGSSAAFEAWARSAPALGGDALAWWTAWNRPWGTLQWPAAD